MKYIMKVIMQRIKRFCNALFFMSYILFHTIVFQKFIGSFHEYEYIVHFHWDESYWKLKGLMRDEGGWRDWAYIIYKDMHCALSEQYTEH